MKNRGNYREAQKLIAYAVSIDTDDIYEEAGKPLPTRLASAVTGAVAHRATENGLNIAADDYDIREYLKSGVEDIHSAIHPYLWKQPSYESALEFVDHDRTAQAIAVLALRSEEAMDNIIKGLDKDPYGQRLHAPYLKLPYGTEPTTGPGGCPAASFGETQPMNPVFKKFVHWSGRLVLASLVHHKINPAFVRGDLTPAQGGE
jgi:hypothetical protein